MVYFKSFTDDESLYKGFLRLDDAILRGTKISGTIGNGPRKGHLFGLDRDIHTYRLDEDLWFCGSFVTDVSEDGTQPDVDRLCSGRSIRNDCQYLGIKSTETLLFDHFKAMTRAANKLHLDMKLVQPDGTIVQLEELFSWFKLSGLETLIQISNDSFGCSDENWSRITDLGYLARFRCIKYMLLSCNFDMSMFGDFLDIHPEIEMDIEFLEWNVPANRKYKEQIDAILAVKRAPCRTCSPHRRLLHHTVRFKHYPIPRRNRANIGGASTDAGEEEN